MGIFAVSVHADLIAGAVALCLDEAGTSVAIVVDDAWRLVGLVDAADAAQAVESVRAGDLARPIAPSTKRRRSTSRSTAWFASVPARSRLSTTRAASLRC